MKINIIHGNKTNNIMMDAEVLSYIFKRVKEKPTVSHIPINTTTIEEVTINIFLEAINYTFLDKAKYNIFVPNQHYFHKNWIDLLHRFDLILCKTNYCYSIFKEYVDEDKLKMIGWRSPDFYLHTVEKEFDQWLLMYSDPFVNDVQKIIDIWKLEYPALNIVFNGVNNKAIKRKNLANINYIEDISFEKYQLLFNKCIVHVCLEEIDNFNHYVNQCMLAKSIPIILDKVPVNDIVNNDIVFKVSSVKKKLKDGLGSWYKYSDSDLESVVKKVISTSHSTLEIMGCNGRDYANRNQGLFVDTITNNIKYVFDKTKHIKFNRVQYINSDLPHISIITPVRNLKDIFKMARLNYTSTAYPKDKREWIIIDDSNEDEKVEDLLPPEDLRGRFGITYIYSDTEMTLSSKLNMGIEKSKNDVILIMNPDDFFYEKTIHRFVEHLMRYDKDCVGVTNYGCFDINRYISIINMVGLDIPYYSRIYLGSLCFYKSFWKPLIDTENEFDILKPLLEHRLDKFSEMYWGDTIVGLIHSRNGDKRKIPEDKESNGCHFKLSEKVFKYVTSLDTHYETEREAIRKEAERRDLEEQKQLEEKNNEKSVNNTKTVKEI
jgi:hypothetical protein